MTTLVCFSLFLGIQFIVIKANDARILILRSDPSFCLKRIAVCVLLHGDKKNYVECELIYILDTFIYRKVSLTINLSVKTTFGVKR